jgi:PAS domain S-box-containing protein
LDMSDRVNAQIENEDSKEADRIDLIDSIHSVDSMDQNQSSLSYRKGLQKKTVSLFLVLGFLVLAFTTGGSFQLMRFKNIYQDLREKHFIVQTILTEVRSLVWDLRLQVQAYRMPQTGNIVPLEKIQAAILKKIRKDIELARPRIDSMKELDELDKFTRLVDGIENYSLSKFSLDKGQWNEILFRQFQDEHHGMGEDIFRQINISILSIDDRSKESVEAVKDTLNFTRIYAALFCLISSIVVFLTMRSVLKVQNHFANKVSELQTALKKRAKELAQTMKAIDTAAIITETDPSGRYISINKNFENISGYSQSETQGQTPRILRSHFHPPDFYAEMWKTLKSGQIWTGELQNRNKKGGFYWVQTAITAIHDEKGNLQKYLSIQFDVSAEKRIQKKLVHATKMSSLGEMSGGIAHEINNPLGIILLLSEAILKALKTDKFETEQLITKVQKIIKTADRISNIVKGLRLFARNDEADPLTDTDCKEIVNEVLALSSDRFSSGSVKLTNTTLHESIMIKSRPSQLMQVLLNLLNNSFDAVVALPEKWVDLKVETIGDNLRMIVTDSGKGIPASVADKMMDPFFTTKEVGKGTGLGLSISRGIVLSHGGSLTYDSTHPNTRFIIEIPLAQSTVKRETSPTLLKRAS